MAPDLQKYPRTQHLQGSRMQPGDEDLDAVPFRGLVGHHVVVEEKVDGANAGISFGDDGEPRLQSRGHYLTGGPRERHFALFKTWVRCHEDALRERLGTRYLLYGEWLYAKHTVFYDQLPHYFMEFDVLDRNTGEFLSTPRRRELLAGAPVVSVRVLWEGSPRRLEDLTNLLGPSGFKGPAWRERLNAVCRAEGLDSAVIRAQTDREDAMEGLYLKVEAGDLVTARYKYLRASFLTAITDAGSHWLSRPIVPNQLRDGADLFAV
jgi:hypothetical protein